MVKIDLILGQDDHIWILTSNSIYLDLLPFKTAWFHACVIAGLHYIWFTDSEQKMLGWIIGIG